MIEEVWDKYDADKNGALDKEETAGFVRDLLGDQGRRDEWGDEDFEESVFAALDKDRSGTIDKPEIVDFMKRLLTGK